MDEQQQQLQQQQEMPVENGNIWQPGGPVNAVPHHDAQLGPVENVERAQPVDQVEAEDNIELMEQYVRNHVVADWVIGDDEPDRQPHAEHVFIPLPENQEDMEQLERDHPVQFQLLILWARRFEAFENEQAGEVPPDDQAQ